MASTDKVCFDKILPSELNRPLSNRMIQLNIGRARAVFYASKLWPNGSNLTIGFIGGTADQQTMVKNISVQWTNYANLTFEFVDNIDNATIRIAFADDGAWSYVGTDSLQIGRRQPTMNFGWLDESVILHEFGHMLGMVHEHQNPIDNPIDWNRDAVIDALSGPPNNWDLATIEHNIFERYSLSQINGSSFDPESIMLYSFPASWTNNGVGTDFNDSLSDIDKEFAGRVYPSTDTPGAVQLDVLEGYSAQIGQPAEEDLYQFNAAEAGLYTIETFGVTDLVMTLFDDVNQMIAQDDDSGTSRNSRIVQNLSPGSYMIQIRHYNQAGGTGSYSIAVVK